MVSEPTRWAGTIWVTALMKLKLSVPVHGDMMGEGVATCWQPTERGLPLQPVLAGFSIAILYDTILGIMGIVG